MKKKINRIQAYVVYMLSTLSYTFISPLLIDSKMFGYSAVFKCCHTYHTSDLIAHDWLNKVTNTSLKMEFTSFPTVHFVITAN